MVELILSDMQGIPYPDCDPIEIADADFITLVSQADKQGMTFSGYLNHVLSLSIIDCLQKELDKNKTTSKRRKK